MSDTIYSDPIYSADYLDLSKAQRVTLPNLKPSMDSISPRLPALLKSGCRISWRMRKCQGVILLWAAVK